MTEKKAVLEKDISAGAGRNEKKGKAEKMEVGEETEGTESAERTKGVGRIAATQRTENKFTKEQMLGAKRFRERRDIVDALLTDGEQYTMKAVEQKIENYMKGKVK